MYIIMIKLEERMRYKIDILKELLKRGYTSTKMRKDKIKRKNRKGGKVNANYMHIQRNKSIY